MSRQHSLLRKDILQTFGGFLWKVMPRNAFYLWSFFNVTETEISSKKRQTSTIMVIRLFCIKTFSSGVFFRFIHDFRRLFPKILSIQPESATRRGSRAMSISFYHPSSSPCVPFTLGHCAWVGNSFQRVAETLWPCGKQPDTWNYYSAVT